MTATPDPRAPNHRQIGSPSGRLLYLYTYLPPDEEWRLYEALMLRSLGDEMLMAVVDDFGAIHVVKEQHIFKRTSAHFFVYADELILAITDIECDWAKRQCWRLAYEDAQRFKTRLNLLTGQ